MSFNIEVQGGTSVRLPTAGKYCDRDIVITATGSDSEPVIQPLEITENGTYTAPDGVDGYSPVTVNVAGSGGHRVRYIESSGLEAIDTGIIIEETDAIECDFELLDLSASGDKMLFGVIADGGSIWAETYGNSNNWYVRFGHTSSVSISWNQYQTAGTIRLQKGKAILNGASAVTLSYTSMPTVSCALFARKTTSGDYGGKRAMRSFGFRIIAASGLPKINLVPWVTDAGDVGMRDLVTGAFFGNVADEGAFVASSY